MLNAIAELRPERLWQPIAGNFQGALQTVLECQLNGVSKWGNVSDESKLKEIVKAAIIEVLEERRDQVPEATTSADAASLVATTRRDTGMSGVLKTILFWIALLLTSVLVYQLVSARH